jgi:hypothetical protein
MSQNTLVEGSLGPALAERRKYSLLSADGLADRIAAHDTAGLSAVVPIQDIVRILYKAKFS